MYNAVVGNLRSVVHSVNHGDNFTNPAAKIYGYLFFFLPLPSRHLPRNRYENLFLFIPDHFLPGFVNKPNNKRDTLLNSF